MDTETEDLLAGPRGRRLCLELAMELEPEIGAAVFDLAYDLDPGKGTSRVQFAMFGPGTNDAGPDAGPGQPASLEELAALLASVDPSRVDADMIEVALERAVGAAMYWQAPEGEDVLAGLPAVRGALRPLADRVSSASLIQQFGLPRPAQQWAIDWRHPDDPAPLGRNPRQALAHWGHSIRVEEAGARSKAEGLDSNLSGPWWSIPTGLVGTVSRIPAGLNLVEDYLGWEDAVAIPVSGTGRTYEIRTEDDWTGLCRRWPLEVTASRRHDWFRTTGRDGRWVIPDWEQVAGEWDAVHLTVPGYLGCAGRALPVEAGTASVIAGWDPDRTIWLTDVVRETGPRQPWHRPRQGDAWVRTA